MAPPDTDPLVRCEDLSIAYDSPSGAPVTVVDRVSFTVAAGEALGIVGESGSGKSTIARALLGYRRAGSRFAGGRMDVAGEAVVTADPAALSRLRGLTVAMVPQNPLASLTYHIPVGRQVEEVLRIRGGLGRAEAAARCLALFEEMGLPDPPAIARRYPHQLSGGQRQRVVIAAALACDPKILVLDEPTTALDKTTEAQVLDLIARLRAERGTTLVLVTHDLNVVAEVCDRVMVMKDGRAVESGTVRAVFRRPATDYARTLLGASLRFGTTAPAAAGGAPTILRAEAIDFRYGQGGWWRRRGSDTTPKTLDGIGFTLARGEILGIIGESGSGKTTLGGIVAGLIAPAAGRLELDGVPIGVPAPRRAAETRRRIQMVFQDPLASLNPRHTVGASVMRPLVHFFGLSRRDARTRAAELLETMGLGAWALDRYPRQLSGGQQQRVAIARAFAAEPDVLVCDEVTSALDASVQAQVIDLLLDLGRRTGTSLLVISHDLAVIGRLAARVLVLRHGRVVEAGETAAVFRDPADAYTRSLLDAARRAARFTETDPPPPVRHAREALLVD